jgi:hypothetical protein
MPERDPQDGPGHAPRTPRASGEVSARLELVDSVRSPQSETLLASSEEAPTVSEPSDTLLSAGKPADRLELIMEDRLALVDQRLRDLDQRLGAVEQKKPPEVDQTRKRPWLWIAFLLALVVAFQLLRAMR